MASIRRNEPDVVFVDIALNTSGVTEIYSHDDNAEVTGVFLNNPTKDAQVQLEVTDGAETGVISGPGVGENLSYQEILRVNAAVALQINVIDPSQNAATGTAVVLKTE